MFTLKITNGIPTGYMITFPTYHGGELFSVQGRTNECSQHLYVHNRKYGILTTNVSGRDKRALSLLKEIEFHKLNKNFDSNNRHSIIESRMSRLLSEEKSCSL